MDKIQPTKIGRVSRQLTLQRVVWLAISRAPTLGMLWRTRFMGSIDKSSKNKSLVREAFRALGNTKFKSSTLSIKSRQKLPYLDLLKENKSSNQGWNGLKKSRLGHRITRPIPSSNRTSHTLPGKNPKKLPKKSVFAHRFNQVLDT